MIALLRGRLVHRTVDEIVVDVAGVGYRVRIPPELPLPGPGEEVAVHTHLAVREDALTLYGFADVGARELFETLLGVTGFGPRLALAAIGTLGPAGLRRAVVDEDLAALTVIPGVGRKSAQRLVLELREKLGAGAADDLPGAGSPAGARGDVREALAALGYAPGEIAGALERLTDPDGDTEALLREALRLLGAPA